MSKQDGRLRRLEEFLAAHAGTIGTALEVYARYMREESGKVTAIYAAIKDDPERRAAQDQSFITTRGLRMTGEILADAATRAEKAHAALADLTDDSDDSDSDAGEVPTVDDLFDALRGNPWKATE